MDKVKKFKRDLCVLKRFKEVSYDEYNEYVREYERKYEIELCDHSIFFCSPPIHGKYDFSLNPMDSDGTVCQVAHIVEGNWYGLPEPDRYFIVGNIEEIKKFVEEFEGQEVYGLMHGAVSESQEGA